MAPEYFQSLNYKNFGDIEGTVVYIDDILIAANSKEEHDLILPKAMLRAKECGLKFNKDKSQFKVSQVKYLGHVFSKKGIEIDPDRIRAILTIKDPKSKEELQRILGTINYVRSFIPNVSELIAPLRELLKVDIHFQWFEHHSKVLQLIKETLTKEPVFVNFD